MRIGTRNKIRFSRRGGFADEVVIVTFLKARVSPLFNGYFERLVGNLDNVE